MKISYLALPLGGVALVLVGLLVFGGLNTNLTYYLTPAEAVEQRAEFPDGRRFRLAGAVQAGTIEQGRTQTTFEVIGEGAVITVVHQGVPPQLFTEGIPVVVEGAWQDDEFVSDTMLVKHDEEYRSPSEEPLAVLEGSQ